MERPELTWEGDSLCCSCLGVMLRGFLGVFWRMGGVGAGAGDAARSSSALWAVSTPATTRSTNMAEVGSWSYPSKASLRGGRRCSQADGAERGRSTTFRPFCSEVKRTESWLERRPAMPTAASVTPCCVEQDSVAAHTTRPSRLLLLPPHVSSKPSSSTRLAAPRRTLAAVA